MTPAPKTNSSEPECLTSLTPNAQDIIRIQQTIISQNNQMIKDLEAKAAESKLKVTSHTLEIAVLRKSMEEMEMRIKVLTEALQLQLEPQVVKLERIGPRIEVRANSFGSMGGAWMGISGGEESARSSTLVEKKLSEALRALEIRPVMISRKFEGAALMESFQSASGIVGEGNDSAENEHMKAKKEQIRGRKDCSEVKYDQGYLLQREREGVEEDNLRLLVVDCE